MQKGGAYMGRPVVDITGQRFGKLVVLRQTDAPHPTSRKYAWWLCQCDCGNQKAIRGDVLRSGGSRSCGCDTQLLQSQSKISQGPKHDLTGQQFGDWTVLRYAGKSKWLCRCSCGTEAEVQTGQLRFGSTHRCKKCNPTKFTKEHSTTHGESNTKLYGVFMGMHWRCENPNARSYHRYGGRGITVCDEWSGEHGYERFSKWSREHGYAEGLEIDRQDNDKGYSPDNCRWVTPLVNKNNTSTNKRIEINGESKTIAEWARAFGLPNYIFYTRFIKLKWPLEKVLNTPIESRGKHESGVKGTESG